MNSEKLIKNNELFFAYIQDKENVEIRNKIFSEYQHIAEIISKKYTNKGIEYDDLYQIACIGLIYAIERYDPERGFEFSSFATPTILGEIKKYFRDKTWSLKIPRRVQELSLKINNAKSELSHKLQRVATISEIASYLSSTEEEILEAMESNNAYSLKSLDQQTENSTEDNSFNLLEIYGKEDEQYKNFENKDFVARVFETLNPLEREIVNKRYLLDEKTQTEVSIEMNISQVTVSRIEKRVLQKFRAEYDKL
ncbi:MAG: SigB/SigF/SigG family RNA polymerase sigma factor [Tissierellales bacterium]|nr:SigB/SigF/SigG family RNA polymerase sigma factor [Tissierellales bacterium]MBN2827195.1 SigB/SigF/SigG family RNA polymerase sigma factor [Tissierellales bacterium]